MLLGANPRGKHTWATFTLPMDDMLSTRPFLLFLATLNSREVRRASAPMIGCLLDNGRAIPLVVRTCSASFVVIYFGGGKKNP